MPPHRRKLQPWQRSEIMGQYDARVPLRQISRNTGFRPSTIHWTVKQSEIRDEAQHDLPRSGQPRKSTCAQDDRLYQHIRINNNLNWADLEDLTIIKHATIQERFNKTSADYHSYCR